MCLQVRDLCRQLHIPCSIRPDVMDSSAPLQGNMIAAFVYQLYLGLTKKAPEDLPPVPKKSQGLKNGYSGGSGDSGLLNDLMPPGVQPQKSPIFVHCSVVNAPESGNLDNEPESPSPVELRIEEMSIAPPGEHLAIVEYAASPTFVRPKFKMYGGAGEDESSSEDESSRAEQGVNQTVHIRKVSDVNAENEGMQDEGAWKGGREVCSSGDTEAGGSQPQSQVDSTAQELTVLDALKEGQHTEVGVSNNPDLEISSPKQGGVLPPQLSVSDITLTETPIPNALTTLSEERADVKEEEACKHSEGKEDGAKECTRRLPTVPGGVRKDAKIGATVIIVLDGTERIVNRTVWCTHIVMLVYAMCCVHVLYTSVCCVYKFHVSQSHLHTLTSSRD